MRSDDAVLEDFLKEMGIEHVSAFALRSVPGEKEAMERAARALAAMLAVHSLDNQSTARQYGSSLSPQEPHGRPQAPAGREEDSGPDR